MENQDWAEMFSEINLSSWPVINYRFIITTVTIAPYLRSIYLQDFLTEKETCSPKWIVNIIIIIYGVWQPKREVTTEQSDHREKVLLYRICKTFVKM